MREADDLPPTGWLHKARTLGQAPRATGIKNAREGMEPLWASWLSEREGRRDGVGQMGWVRSSATVCPGKAAEDPMTGPTPAKASLWGQGRILLYRQLQAMLSWAKCWTEVGVVPALNQP
jgi:hypothetical protein